MKQTWSTILGVVALVAFAQGRALAHGGLAIGVNFGVPVYAGPPWGCGYWYRPYPVYVAPPPVIIQPTPVYQAVPVAPPACPAPASVPSVSRSPVADPNQAEVERHLQLLTHADERVRADSVMQLGRLRAQAAVDPLAATLAGDLSPVVRESAARALGLIGSPRALTALQHAAQADTDRDVRHSAEFAYEVVLASRRP